MPTTPTDILDRLRAANPAPVSPERANQPPAPATLERILADPGPDARSGSPRRGHRRGHRWLSAAPVLATMVVTLVVAGAALVLLGRGHGPAAASHTAGRGIAALIAHTPKHQLDREMAYVLNSSVLNSKACQVAQPSRVSYINGSPGRDLRSILGVLRRPASLADRFNPQRIGPIQDVYRGATRRAFAADGVSYYIVPTRFDRAAVAPSERCLRLQNAAFNRHLPRVPASMRQPTREIHAALVAYWRTNARQAPADAICLVAVGGSGIGSSCGLTAKGIEAGFATENSPGPNLNTFSGIVPDGVASVTAIFPGAASTHPVTARVEGNVYAVHVLRRAGDRFGSLPSPIVIWRSARGRILKRVSTSDAARRAYICRHDPVGCLLVQVSTVDVRKSSSGGARRVAPTPAQ